MHMHKPTAGLTLGLLALTAGLSLTTNLTGIRPAHALSPAAVQSTSLAALTARLDADEASIRNLKSMVQTLRQSNTVLTARVATVQSHAQGVTTNDTTYGPFTVSGTDVYLTGYNLHILNGSGKTNSVNGLGNLIVGYNETKSGNTHTGSHDIIVGQYHTYSSYGGLVAGYSNSITGAYASVSGGNGNTASATCAAVSGGFGNKATGSYASVVGGNGSTASATYGLEPVTTSIASLQTQLTNQSKITGLFSLSNGIGTNTELTLTGVNFHLVDGSGSTNDGGGTLTGLGNLIIGYNETRASAGGYGDARTGSHNIIAGEENNYSSFGGIVGGTNNTLSGSSAFSVGAGNTASGRYSSITGGISSTASAYASSVNGGYYNTASGYISSVSGGESNTASNNYSSVSGGYNRLVSISDGWAAGSNGSTNYSGNFASP